jgi:hypothetical protein
MMYREKKTHAQATQETERERDNVSHAVMKSV